MGDERGWRGGYTVRGRQLPPTASAVLDVYERRVLVAWISESKPLPVQARAELVRLEVRVVGACSGHPPITRCLLPPSGSAGSPPRPVRHTGTRAAVSRPGGTAAALHADGVVISEEPDT